MSKNKEKNYYNLKDIFEEANKKYSLTFSTRYLGKTKSMIEKVLIPYLEEKANRYGELFGNDYREAIQILICELKIEILKIGTLMIELDKDVKYDELKEVLEHE